MHPVWREMSTSSASEVSMDDDLPSAESIQSYNEDHATTALVEIKRCENKGWGLYARKDIPKDTVVFRSRALKVLYDDKDTICREKHDQRNSHTVQTDWNRHVIMDLPAILVNHSCHANVGIHENDHGAFDYLALRNIQHGEEVLWDYETSEYYIQSQFVCSCGAKNCRGFLKGFHANGRLVEELYGKEFIAPYLFQRPS
jgi:SET domain-containing protein